MVTYGSIIVLFDFDLFLESEVPNYHLRLFSDDTRAKELDSGLLPNNFTVFEKVALPLCWGTTNSDFCS